MSSSGVTIPVGTGGFTTGTALINEDLNTITTVGLYRQFSAANASLVLNYPSLSAGLLEVFAAASGGDLLQRFTTHGGASAAGRMIYIRRLLGATWSTWSAYSSLVWSDAIGRTVYAWDPNNNRSQLVYGDTGSRDIFASHCDETKWESGVLKLRRVGSEVELRGLSMNNVPGTVGTVQVLKGSLPVGFRNQHTVIGITSSGTVMSKASATFNASQVTLEGVVDGTNSEFVLKWQTTDAWPAALPGNADGSIPNA